MAERDEEKIKNREERSRWMKELAVWLDKSSNPEIKGAAGLAMLANFDLGEDVIAFQDAVIHSMQVSKEVDTEFVLAIKRINERLNRIEHAPQIESPEIKALAERVAKQEYKFGRYERTLETLEAWSEGKFRRWFRDTFGGGS